MQDEQPRHSEKFDWIPKGALTRWCQESSPGIPSRALGRPVGRSAKRYHLGRPVVICGLPLLLCQGSMKSYMIRRPTP